MVATSFIYGFVSALLLMGCALAAIYVALQRHRERTADIKGYLDLIPDLTGEQRARLQEIRRVFLPKVAGIRHDMRLQRSELAELLFTEPPDKTRIYEVAEKIIGWQSELEHEVIEHILEEQQLLTPAQKTKFYEIIVEQFSWGGLGVHDVRAKTTATAPRQTRSSV
jgi:hypothetical protein